MKLQLGRIVLAALAAEFLGVLSLIALVAMFRPANLDPDQTQAFAEHLGIYVGPISGFVLCMAGGYWVARSAKPFYLGNGVALGLAGALLDLVIAAALGASLQWLLLLSNAGRVLGGFLGGLVAARRFSHTPGESSSHG
jgi:hypothetical protein